MSADKEIILETVRHTLSSDPSFQSQWESIINDLISSQSTNSAQSIADQLRQSGVLDSVVRRLRANQSPKKSNVVVAKITESGTNYQHGDRLVIPATAQDTMADMSFLEELSVQLSIKAGLNLVDYAVLNSVHLSQRPVIQLVCCYPGDRYTSDLYLAAQEISFSTETQFAFKLPLPHNKNFSSLGPVLEYFMALKQSVSVYLLEYRQSHDSWIPSLKMHGTLEWRHCLHRNETAWRTELKGIGQVSQQVLGALEIEAKLSMDLPGYIEADVLELHFSLEQSNQTKAERAFMNYARLWHQDFCELNSSMLARRAVKLFVRDERGFVKFVSSFVDESVSPGRVFETPQHCARFVSLIGNFENELQAGEPNEESDIWISSEATLVSNSTNKAGRAILLCNLFLGLGLNTYICIGRAAPTDLHQEEEVTRVWVMTSMPGGESGFDRVTFWDPLSGQSFLVRPKSSILQQCPFHTLDSVFRHDFYAANIQPSNRIVEISFDFDNSEDWRLLDVSGYPKSEQMKMQSGIQPWSNRRFGTNHFGMADWLEMEFRKLFNEHRKNLDLSYAEYDSKLSCSLGMALANYEMMSTFGSNFVMSKDFLAATRNLVSSNAVLRAVPMQLPLESVSIPARALTSALTRCQSARDVVELPGHSVKFGLRVKIVPFAERIAAVWLMLASYSKTN